MTLSPIANLSELAVIQLLTTFPFTDDSKDYFKGRMPPDIHHLICQTVINKRPDLLEKLKHFCDPGTWQTHSVRDFTRFSHLSADRIVFLLSSVFPHLKKLDLSKTTITQLVAFKQLEELNFSYGKVSGKEFVVLKEKFLLLRKLDLSYTQIERNGDNPLPLQTIDIEACKGLPLEELNLEGGWFDVSNLDIIRKEFPRLKKINLNLNLLQIGHRTIKLAGLSLPIKLAGLPLEELFINTSGISNNDLQTIKEHFPQIKKLDISNAPFEKREGLDQKFTSLEKLAGLPLEELNICRCDNLSAQEFLTINQKFSSLKKLNLACTNVASLSGLEGLPLEELNICHCDNLSAQEFLTINKKFPHLKKLNLKATTINSLSGLEGLPLEELNICRCDNLSAQEFLTINKKFPHLKKLNLKTTTINSLSGLEGLPIEELNLMYCLALSAQEFLTINHRFPSLKKLNLASTSIASLSELEGLPLEELNIYQCEALSAPEFLTIKEKLPHLKKLDLTYTKIASLSGLEGLPLEELSVRQGNQLPDNEYEKFKQAHPWIKITG